MKSKLFTLTRVCTINIVLTAMSGMVLGQSTSQSFIKGTPNEKNASVFPRLTFTKIKGAPSLMPPTLVMGETMPVMSEGQGWAAPVLFDINNDGKKDLLIGEFNSGVENSNGLSGGNFVRVYKNEGTEAQPRFSDVYNYLYGIREAGNGTPLSVYTWCCMGFTPRFADLNNDGYMDLLTGQYNPGVVTWFRGTEKGFLPGERVPQFRDDMTSKKTNSLLSMHDPESWEYWNYSTVDFGDFEGKGLYDMIVGGDALRISRNTGTKTQPAFGRRELLLDIHGNPLTMNRPKNDTLKSSAGEPYYGFSMVPTVADWDNDGVPDLLVTDSYFTPGSNAVVFFRAVRTPQGLRFEPGVPLFTADKGAKSFPGSWLRVSVGDWNNDGVNDLIVGASVATVNDKFHPYLSWNWESETAITKKNPGYYSLEMRKTISRQLAFAATYEKRQRLNPQLRKLDPDATYAAFFKNYYVKEEYKTLAHKGYIYVMLGSNNK